MIRRAVRRARGRRPGRDDPARRPALRERVRERRDRLRILDWGDSSVGHPFVSLVVTFRFLEEVDELPIDHPIYARVRDAYLEPLGADAARAFPLALRVGAFAHALAWTRQRDHLDGEDRARFDRWYRVVLRRALAQIPEP